MFQIPLGDSQIQNFSVTKIIISLGVALFFFVLNFPLLKGIWNIFIGGIGILKNVQQRRDWGKKVGMLCEARVWQGFDFQI